MDTKRTLLTTTKMATAGAIGLCFGELGGDLLRAHDPWRAVGWVFLMWVLFVLLTLTVGALVSWGRQRRSVEPAVGDGDTLRDRLESGLTTGFSGELVRTAGMAGIVGIVASVREVGGWGIYGQVFVSLAGTGALAALACCAWGLYPGLASRIRTRTGQIGG